LPLRDSALDLAVFNASLHYALDLPTVLAQAMRVVRPGGRIAIVDSPFYADEADGRAMVAEKRARGTERFGNRAGNLLAVPFIEYLTPAGLAAASAPLGMHWVRIRVRYPLWYELRPLQAWLGRRRRPSRFDLWVAEVR
jgi:SAM-dependent methyltransferase